MNIFSTNFCSRKHCGYYYMQSCVSIEDFKKAEQLLQQFCLKFAAFYGKLVMHTYMHAYQLYNQL